MVSFGSTYAQEVGDIAVGVSIEITPGWVEESRTEDEPKSNNGGFGAKIQYNVTKPIRLEGVFVYLPSSDRLGMWNININAHYLFPVMKS